MPRAHSPRFPLSQRAGTEFTADQWRSLTRLPAEVMIVTISFRAPGQCRTVAEGLAGLDAIAAGRASDSDLVRAVVSAIYSEPEEDRPELTGPRPEPDEMFGDCRRVAAILRAADPADAAAYRHWVQQVAVRVLAAARAVGDGIGSSGGDRGERVFLNDLGSALA